VGIATAPLDTISEVTRAFLGLVDGL